MHFRVFIAYFFLLLNYVLLYCIYCTTVCLYAHLLRDMLGGFQSVVIVNNATINICVHLYQLHVHTQASC